MALLAVLGLKPTGAVSSGGAAKVTGMQSPEMKALIARFQGVMVDIKALEAAQAPEAAALKKAAVAAGNLSTSARGVLQANAALDQVEAQVRDAKAKSAAGDSPQKPTPAAQPSTAPQPVGGGISPTAAQTAAPKPADAPPAEQDADGQPKPEFKGYPATLEKAEGLIGKVTKYGFHESGTATSMKASVREGVDEIWCSGLSNWALAEAGYNLDKPIPGKTCFSKDPKTGKVSEQPMTLRSLVEGYPENLADTKEEAGNGYAQAGLFGKTAAEDDPRVKGAAGAFVLAKIGTEITDLDDVKPGDFAQTRVVGSGEGHAFQIQACHCQGECLVGSGNSPTLVKDLGGDVIDTEEGKWYGKASFRIDGKTSPLYVGAHKVVNSDLLESNIAAAMEDKNDKDGGVQIRHGRTIAQCTAGGKRMYVGRLASSSWAGYSRANAPLKKPETQAAPEDALS
jgi:hypothetical protein